MLFMLLPLSVTSVEEGDRWVVGRKDKEGEREGEKGRERERGGGRGGRGRKEPPLDLWKRAAKKYQQPGSGVLV